MKDLTINASPAHTLSQSYTLVCHKTGTRSILHDCSHKQAARHVAKLNKHGDYYSLDDSVWGYGPVPSGYHSPSETEGGYGYIECTLVPEQNYKGFVKKFEKLQSKAERLGLDVPTFKERGTAEHTESRCDDGIRSQKVRRYHVITVTPAKVAFDGWSFVAAIQHLTLDDGQRANVLAVAPAHQGRSLDPKYRNAHPVCEHCNTARKRNDTYIIEHEDQGLKQVGRTCLRDYVGDADGTSILAYARFLAEFKRTVDEDSGWGSGSAYSAYTCADVVPLLVHIIRTTGWISGGQAYDSYSGMVSTKLVLTSLLANLGSSAANVKQDAQAVVDAITDADRDHGAAALAWIRDQDTDAIADNDYLWNLYVVCNSATIPDKGWGLFASLIAAYDRHLGDAIKAQRVVKQQAESTYLGSPGDKIGRKLTAADKRKGSTAHPEITVTLERTYDAETQWGYTTLVSLLDADGHVFTWWASGGACDADAGRLKVGATYTLVATIKGHKEYNGIKQTLINRAILTVA